MCIRTKAHVSCEDGSAHCYGWHSNRHIARPIPLAFHLIPLPPCLLMHRHGWTTVGFFEQLPSLANAMLGACVCVSVCMCEYVSASKAVELKMKQSLTSKSIRYHAYPDITLNAVRFKGTG